MSTNEKKSNFAQVVQKGAVRAKEKLLVNLGKVDKTKDELFDDYIANFSKQQTISNKLYKDLRAYINSIQEQSACETSLYEAIKETYEPDWHKQDLMYHLLDSANYTWLDYVEKLENQVLIPLNAYNNQFNEIKEKINKRSRKLLYFDSARHNYDTLINTNGKKRDEIKIKKAFDQLNEAKKIFQDLNSELHESLPALYQSRISFLVSHFQSLFAADLQFHNEMAKINNELSEIMDGLAEGIGKTEKAWQPLALSSSLNSKSVHSLEDTDESVAIGRALEHQSQQMSRALNTDSISANNIEQHSNKFMPSVLSEEREIYAPDEHPTSPPKSLQGSPNNVMNNNSSSLPKRVSFNATKPLNENTQNSEIEISEGKNPFDEDEIDDHSLETQELKNTPNIDSVAIKTSPRIIKSAMKQKNGQTTNTPSLQKVKALFKYVQEDDDELNLEPGDIIRVLPASEFPEDLDPGWLYGENLSSGIRGVFPENHTKKIT